MSEPRDIAYWQPYASDLRATFEVALSNARAMAIPRVVAYASDGEVLGVYDESGVEPSAPALDFAKAVELADYISRVEERLSREVLGLHNWVLNLTLGKQAGS